MGKAIVFTSGKGGTGKTTAVAAISSCLAALGHRTLCIDGDVGLRNLDLSLGMSDAAFLDFRDVIEGRCTLEDACTPHPKIENLFLLTSPADISPTDVDPNEMTRLMEMVKEQFSYCLVDAPAGIGAGFRLASCGSDMAVILATADSSSLRDAQRTVLELGEEGILDIRLIVNRIKPSFFRKAALTVDTIIDLVGARLLGVVPEDSSVTLSASREEPLILFSGKGASPAFLRIAKRLLDQDVPLKY